MLTKQDKMQLALLKLKEIKLLANEVVELLNDDTVKKHFKSSLKEVLSSMVQDELRDIDTSSPNGVRVISNFEKQRRINYGNATHETNQARKEFYELERCVGEVGRYSTNRFHL